MNKNYWLIILCVSNFICNSLFADDVTYLMSGGRFGDNLVAYVHAKWVAYKHGLTFRYRPFPYSDQLVLHKKELLLDKKTKYIKVVTLKNSNDLNKVDNSISNILYQVPYYPECKAEYQQFKKDYPFYYEVDWNDIKFLDEIRRLIKPVQDLPHCALPTDRICVALHLRKGGGYDEQSLSDGGSIKHGQSLPGDVAFPLKFPPDTFYIERLKSVSAFFHHAPLYVYIFTDDQNPSCLATKYQDLCSLSNVIFDYRKTKNTWKNNVLEDFFSMMYFDVLIRSESSFSLIASRLARHQLTVFPLEANYGSNVLMERLKPLEIIKYAVLISKR